ncbi:uncharacterized protein BJ171DRAFT_596259 [Polychytrium aggregatum]|uniref:uncharacterized protein n=1 Tax=Polychytrium aggregatum TaxID=110093 RepID=UPI0022FF31BE|nr:uncharacterized protein BJ171DRAFT_596259 [Polychytrium aggregatum]KAI9207829.1 hypothetical protein BJ171DRAFT_596259 [Polychytrium aggregatum]
MSTDEVEFANEILVALASKSASPLRDAETPLQLAPPLSQPVELSLPRIRPDDLNPKITVTIKVLKSTTPPLTLTLSQFDLIRKLKQQVSNAHKIPVDSIRLVLSGKALHDFRSLLDYDVKSGATIHLQTKASTGTEASESATDPVGPVLDRSALESEAEAANREQERSDAALAQKGLSPDFWKSIHELIGREFEHPADAKKVYGEFVKSYLSSISRVSPSDRQGILTAAQV